MPPPPQDYTQDAARRVQAREHAMLGLATPLADEAGEIGPMLLPFTPWHHFILMGLENPLVGNGRPVTWGDVLQALWVCSPKFSLCSTWNKAAFRFRWNTLKMRRAAPRIIGAFHGYVRFAFIDSPPVAVGMVRPAPRAGLPDEPLDLARLEFVCRRELRYTLAEFWHTPYAHTMQLLSMLHETKTPGAVRFDEGARQVKEILARRRRGRAATKEEN